MDIDEVMNRWKDDPFVVRLTGIIEEVRVDLVEMREEAPRRQAEIDWTAAYHHGLVQALFEYYRFLEDQK